MENKMYFLFVPIADKKKFLSMLITAPNDKDAVTLVKEEMPKLFPGDQPVQDEEIIFFTDIGYPGDVLAEIMKVKPDGTLAEGSWIAIMKNGQAYTLDNFKNKEQVIEEFKKQLGKEHPNAKFTGDLYDIVGDEYVVLLQVNFTEEFLTRMNFGQLIPDANTTIH